MKESAARCAALRVVDSFAESEQKHEDSYPSVCVQLASVSLATNLCVTRDEVK